MAKLAGKPPRGPSLESVRHCYRYYIAGAATEIAGPVVLDVGGDDASVWRQVFDQPPFSYRTHDPAGPAAPGAALAMSGASGAPLAISGAPGAALAMSGAPGAPLTISGAPGAPLAMSDAPGALYRIPLADSSADVVLASPSADHPDFIWRIIPEMLRVLRPDGCMFLALPACGLIHRVPTNRYRFLADPCAALAEFAGCTLAADWTDARGPWHDRIGVFRRADAPALPYPPQQPPPAAPAWRDTPGSAEEEAIRGEAHYLGVLGRLQAELSPAHYLEIGVRAGHSLALARGPATGIDPAPAVDVPLPRTTELVRATSDAYFAAGTSTVHPDLAFIDGMHLVEFALRDFMNIERRAAPGAVVAIDDIFPNHLAQAERDRRTRVWAGDVWRLAEILRTWRPDLFLLPIDTAPTGLLLVAGLDPSNNVLWDAYSAVVRGALETPAPPPAVIARSGALAPSSDTLRHAIAALRRARAERCPPREVVARLREAAALDSGSRQPLHPAAPRLSLIVIGHNMPRELPRTIRSLSPMMQRDIDPRDYEVILIDNGSARPADPEQLRALLPGLAIYRMRNPTVSPVPAINFGLSVARGDLVGVCIDGARMASPGLLSKALAASRLHERPVIGTIGFHLGPAVQSESIRHGYNEAVEDGLLLRSGWEADGYRLFSIASFAASSSGGWFALPTESNALFLRAAHWRALGGWDSGFVTPGGGFANLDTWARACADPSGAVIMLLGEATFHQIHGGVATNNLNPPMASFHEEYVRLRGHAYRPPARQPLFFGALPDAVRKNLEQANGLR